jgi:hypothetical protein
MRSLTNMDLSELKAKINGLATATPPEPDPTDPLAQQTGTAGLQRKSAMCESVFS